MRSTLAKRCGSAPAARTKAHREHRVPLSPRALEIANQMQLQRRKGRLVFPGRGDGISVSEAGVRYVMQSLGCGSYTVHGFRSAFRDWCGEQTNFPREVAEAAWRIVSAMQSSKRMRVAICSRSARA